MNKHAYLIGCHGNWEVLKILLKMLDNVQNDIYVHVDKKARDFPMDEIASIVTKSGLYFSKRLNTTWGGYSQIQVELTLLKQSVSNNYSYYHFISGVDLPIKSQDKIHQFFLKNQGSNFISFGNSVDVYGRIGRYFFFQEKRGHGFSSNLRIYSFLDKVSQKIQQYLNIDRTCNYNFRIFKGSQWFSITHQLAVYVLSCEPLIKKYFRYSRGADELFIQTIAVNSKFASTIQNNCLRLIDWKRAEYNGSSPHIFRLEDYEMIMTSDESKLFARKFDENVDFDIVKKIYHNLG